MLEFGSPDGSRLFDFYRNRSAPALGGTIDADFWGGLVLQLSMAEPAVQHAVLALSSVYELANERKVFNPQGEGAFALAEYGKAIGALRQWDAKNGSVAIPLLVCVLFTCIEFMLDHESTSQLHICQGRQILSRLENSSSPDVELIKRELVPIYARLSMSSFLFGSIPASIPVHLRSAESMPRVFTSLAQARKFLYYHIDDCLRFTHQGRVLVYSPIQDEAEMARLRVIQHNLFLELSRWNSAYVVLTATLPSSQLSPYVQNQLSILYHAAAIWISVGLDRNETAFDAHIHNFAAIISLASSSINMFSKRSQHNIFSFETELIAPLYWTAIKCRHPQLRAAALGLLMRDDIKTRRENLWHAEEVIVIATRVIEMEEEEWEGEEDQGDEQGAVTPTDEYGDLDRLESTESSESRRGSENSYSIEAEIFIPVSKPPSLPRPPIILTDDLSSDPITATSSMTYNQRRGTPGRLPTPISVSSPSAATTTTKSSIASVTEPPYGIPERRRVKNAVIGPRGSDGILATFFREPDDGQPGWNITKELLVL